MDTQQLLGVLEAPGDFSFDDLLKDSMAQAEERNAEKELKKKVSRGQGTNEDNATVKRWSREREWKRTANVLAFTRQQCHHCGEFSTTLDGRFELHTHSRIPNTTLLNSVPSFELDLPKQVVYRDSYVAECHECADEHDWPLEA